MKRFHSSYVICSRFYLNLIRVSLNEHRKERVVEGSNQHHAKDLGEKMTSGASRPLLGRPACTCGPFADVQARCTLFQVSCLGQFDEKRRPAGLVSAARLELSSDFVQVSL